MPGGRQAEERQRQKAKELQRQKALELQRRRSLELHYQRQQLLRLALANSHNRWFQEFILRPDAEQMYQKWLREYDGFDEFMTKAFTADLND